MKNGENKKELIIMNEIDIIQNIDLLDPILKTGGMLGKSVAKTVVLRIFRHIILNQPDHVIERVFNSFSSGQEYNDKKLQCGDTIRADWYFENDNNIKFVEDLVRQIITDTQGKKSEYITKFHVNIRFSSNDDIDEHTAFSYLETMESLSWRQLCIIGVVILYENKEVNMSPIGVAEGNIGAVEEKDLKHIQMSQDEWTRFYSISRDFQKLIDNKYLQTTISENVDRNEPFLDSLHAEHIPDSTRRLHSLMNLNEIPIEDIVETFSPWKVRLRKSE